MMLLSVALFAVSALSVIAGLAFLFRFCNHPVNLARPECRRCAYDLRQWNYFTGKPTPCPRCKAVLRRHGVRCVSGRRVWGTLARAIALLLAPLPLIWGVVFIVEYQTGDRYKTTAQLIQNVGGAAAMPMYELQRRVKRGDMKQGEVTGVLQAWQGRRLPGRMGRGWSDDAAAMRFLLDAHARGLVAPDLRASVIQTVAGTPKLTSDISDTQKKMLRLKIDFGGSALGFGPLNEFKPVVALQQLSLADGTVIASRDRAARPDRLSGGYDLNIDLDSPLPPGQHTLTAILDCGVLPAGSPLLGVGGLPGSPEKWQNPLAVWEATVSVTVTMGKD